MDSGVEGEVETPLTDRELAWRAGVAAIKPEYLFRRVQSSSSAVGAEGGNMADAEVVTVAAEPAAKRPRTDGDWDKDGKKGKGRKGQNKQRPKPTLAQRFCMRSLYGELCAIESCRYEHDLDMVLASMPPALPGPCPLVQAFGVCRSGPLCRFAPSHPPGMQLTRATKGLTDELNVTSGDLQKDLRKGTFTFPRATAFLRALEVAGGNAEAATAALTATPVTENTSSSTMDAGAEAPAEAPAMVIEETRCTDYLGAAPEPRSRRPLNFRGKLYLAPLTTVGNLPFRRVCKSLGVDITCGEMAMAQNLLAGQQSEWALLRKHPSEDIFGVQICGHRIDTISQCAELICQRLQVDFIDLNCGCPIDLVFNRGQGSALCGRPTRMEGIVRGMKYVMGDVPMSIKLRTGIKANKSTAHTLIDKLPIWGANMITLHGRSREQRYTKTADWDYVERCSKLAGPAAFFGNGDILSYEEAVAHRQAMDNQGLMIARGALIKPWIFTEIKETRHWDISSAERMDYLRDYVRYGLEHWGSDIEGVEKTRRFLLEWMSFLHRYIPLGVLERVPVHINQRPPPFVGRDDLETLMASTDANDWVKISEMLLGKVPDDFVFVPKHKANSYAANIEG